MKTEVQELFPETKPVKGGRLKSFDEYRKRLNGTRFILTCAQNNTKLHDKFWKTLTRMAEKLNAQLCVAKITYNKNGWQKITKDSDDVWYDDRIKKYIIDEQVKLADDLVFCAELDILPTAVIPLNGLQNYSGPNSAIIPHTKMQMQSLATMKHEPAKFLYSTGTVTQRNYIQRRAGQVAEYHHIYGAIYVEIDADGKWFARQLNADEDGTVFDLDHVWMPCMDAPVSETGGRSIITLGDIHLEKLDPQAFAGALELIRAVTPSDVFLHDLVDFTARNHHNIEDAHFLVERFAKKLDRIEDMFIKCATFLKSLTMAFPDTKFHIVRSNHDEAFLRWIKAPMKNIDPANLRFWHECNAMILKHVEWNQTVDEFAWAIFKAAEYKGIKLLMERIHFVQVDESCCINGVEYGMHGHYGPNGARGNPKAFRQIGRRVNHGHTHSANIIDGVYTAGVLGSLDMGYNKGPSSWSHSSIITYPNAKRAIVSQRGIKWRAQ